jgi:hypothetical protein
MSRMSLLTAIGSISVISLMISKFIMPYYKRIKCRIQLIFRKNGNPTGTSVPNQPLHIKRGLADLNSRKASADILTYISDIAEKQVFFKNKKAMLKKT